MRLSRAGKNPRIWIFLMRMKRTAKAFSASDSVTRPEGSRQDQPKSEDQLCFLKKHHIAQQSLLRRKEPWAHTLCAHTCWKIPAGARFCCSCEFRLLLILSFRGASWRAGTFFPPGGNPTNVCPAYGSGSKTADQVLAMMGRRQLRQEAPLSAAEHLLIASSWSS